MLKFLQNDKCSGRFYPEPTINQSIYSINPYRIDIERILQSNCFARLQYKTQVFVNHQGDHYRNRLTHSLEVARIAKQICKILDLNEDLAEVIALSHDIGHTPFGHAGEDELKKQMKDFGGFCHNAQTIYSITEIENYSPAFPGLNLTLDTLDGLIKHNGVITEKSTLYSRCIDLGISPFKNPSLEAQISAISDDIAYYNHDISDGFRAGMLEITDLEQIGFLQDIIKNITSSFGKISNEHLIIYVTNLSKKLMIEDLIQNINNNVKKLNITSVEDIFNSDNFIAVFSHEMQKNIEEIRAMLYKKVYRNYKINRMSIKAYKIIKDLFTLYFDNPNCLPSRWQSKLGSDYTPTELAVVIKNYITGMTDRYAISEYLSFHSIKHDPNSFM
jgi:dGTPase